MFSLFILKQPFSSRVFVFLFIRELPSLAFFLSRDRANKFSLVAGCRRQQKTTTIQARARPRSSHQNFWNRPIPGLITAMPYVNGAVTRRQIQAYLSMDPMVHSKWQKILHSWSLLCYFPIFFPLLIFLLPLTLSSVFFPSGASSPLCVCRLVCLYICLSVRPFDRSGRTW